MLLQQEMMSADGFGSSRSSRRNISKSPDEKQDDTDGKTTIRCSTSEVREGGTSSEYAIRDLFDDDSPAEVYLSGRTRPSMQAPGDFRQTPVTSCPMDNWFGSQCLQLSHPSEQQADAAAAAAAAHFASLQPINAHFASRHHSSMPPSLLPQPKPMGKD